MIRLNDISNIMQSYTAILSISYKEKRGSLTYHLPSREKANSIITKNLLKYFLEYCLDTANKTYNIDDAVLAEVRESLATEKWMTNSDSLDMLTDIKDRKISCSIYRGIDRMINNGRFPVYVPQLSLIFDGIEVVRTLQSAGIPCSGEAQKVMQYWNKNELSKIMQMKVLDKPNRRAKEKKVASKAFLNDKHQVRADIFSQLHGSSGFRSPFAQSQGLFIPNEIGLSG